MTMYSYSYTTMHTYDKANQLVSSTTNGKVTEYAYDAAKNRIDTNWRAKEDQTTPNWQLSNNCMNFMLDVFDATGKSSEIDTSSWRTNGWLDPRKGYTWMLQNGGKIKE